MREHMWICAGAAAELRCVGASEGFELVEAEAPEGGAAKPARFSMVAYTGVPMRLDGYWSPVVVDLDSLKPLRQSVPTLRGHDPERIAGHTTSIEVTATRVKASGVLSGSPAHTDEVVATARGGFPWQASIGAAAERMEYVGKGETVKVNGRNWDGPLLVARGATIREISLVPMGADGNTSAAVAAQYGGQTVEFNAWLQAKGFDPAALTEQQTTALKAAFDADQTPKPAPVPPPQPDPAAEIRAAAAAEARRVADIRRVCAADPGLEVEANGAKVNLLAHAIASGWDVTRTELEALRATRATVRVVTPADAPAFRDSASTVEAALCLTLGLPKVEAQFKPEVLEAAHKRYRNVSLQQILLTAAAEGGYHAGPGARIHTGNLREVLRAAFSSVTLPGILGNVANKNLVAGYTEEDDTWRQVSAVKPASNFQTRTYYRMLDNMEYEEVGPSGEIKHGTVDQESYTASLKTFAKMFALTRRDIINDDLGAFNDLRNRLGRGAKKKFNNLFWTNFLASHSTFFTSGRGNYITGSTTTLLTDGVGLGLALKAFRQMKSPASAGSDDGGKRINARPAILLVPPELEYAADQLFMGQKLASSAGDGPTNVYAGKYRPVVNAWLSDSNFTGYSATAWYLFRAASDLPMMTVSFLNGQEMPTVEDAEADFDTLGVQFRGYHDFHADQAEYLCGVKSKGAA